MIDLQKDAKFDSDELVEEMIQDNGDKPWRNLLK